MTDLKVALIGGGFMGRAHSLALGMAPVATDLGVTVTKEVLVDIKNDTDLIARRLGWNSYTADWRPVVERDDIDIVDICTPPQFHSAIALAAIAAGKHIFCEKPIANDAAEAEQMAKAAREAGVVVQVGHNYRHTPAITFAKRLLDLGQLGVPLQFRGYYLQEGGFWADPQRWRANKSTGGSGTVGDIGSHVIDIAEYLFGDIVKVSARMRSRSSASDQGWLPEAKRIERDLIDDGGVWLAEFESDAIGIFSVSSFASGSKNRLGFEFDASKGSVEFNWNNREQFRVSYVNESPDHLGFRTIHTNSNHPDGWWHLAGLGMGYLDVSAIQFQHFLSAIVNHGRSRPDFDDAVHGQRVVAAIAAASASDRWVDVPLREEPESAAP